MFFPFSRLDARALALSFTCGPGIDAAEDDEFNGAATEICQSPWFNLNRNFSGSGGVDQIDPFSGMPKTVAANIHLPGNVVFDMVAGSI